MADKKYREPVIHKPLCLTYNSMQNHLKILLLEDNETDAEIIRRLLLKEIKNCAVRHATNKKTFLHLLDHFHHDIILSDHSLPQFNSVEAIKIGREVFPDIPFILLSGTISEEFAIEIMKSGADDFILKDRINRLPSAIHKAIKQRKIESEKKEIQQRIIHSESNLRAIFENTSEGFLLMDANGIVKAFNPKAAEFGFFLKGDEIKVGDRLPDFIDDSRKDIFRKIMSQVLHKENIKYERIYESEDGGKRWIDFSITPVIENEKITGICITGRDVTDRKLAEEEIEFDHNNLNALINNTEDLMWSIDKNLKLITCNDSFNKVIMHTPGKSLPKGENIPASHFNEEQVKRYKAFYGRALSGETFTITDHFEDPVELWVEVSFNPIYNNKEVIGAACFSHDITRRKKGEEERKRISSILEATSDLVGIADIDQKVIYLNKGGREMLGYGETEDITGKYIAAFLDEENYKAISEVYLPIALKVGKWSGELNILTKTGKAVNVSVVIIIHKTADGKPQYISAIARDISERKKAEKNLKLMEQKILTQKIEGQKKITRAIIQAQEKERNHLGQELHDNINQILAATKLHLDIAGRDNPALKHIVTYPIELISSAIGEIKQLSARHVTPTKNINLKELVTKIVNEFGENTSVKMDFIFNVNQKIKDDNLKLNVYRIIQEQLNNIHKHADARHVSIVIESSDLFLHLQVTDDGNGFDMKKKRKGIGISNIMNRVESFNGSMKIKTSPGQGCRTDIYIPFIPLN